MNEAGARGGAFLSNASPSVAAAAAAASAAIVSNGGSPSRLSGSDGGYLSPTSSSGGAFDPFADQEELLFTEQYPGKLCALCNLSERSHLGQGDMVKYKVPADFDLSAEVKKRRSQVAVVGGGNGAAESNGEGSSVESSPRHPSSSSSSTTAVAILAAGGLNARRKGRKMTSGDVVGEPVDELDNVGFTEEPDHNLLFETSGEPSLVIDHIRNLDLFHLGHFYVHERCSYWSHGVVTKKETSLEEAVHSRGLSGLEGAVIEAAWQRCAHCKHFGASVKCKASGLFYHFPCAAASGSFMHKASMSLVGSASLAKVASLGENVT